ncbi:MAG: hypothetical protein HOD92_25320 [Deltaproteobacteria bacterium]|jgi:hypothetical protein|nr:hypothetical protein [Deltaproteobacteria bacterium]MBT4525081.1 hypothetical protein [Deltaproteobacteria bacterium]
MNKNHNKMLSLLQDNLSLLKTSQATLSQSYEKCKKIGIKKVYTFEQLESFDSLTSKFARTSDIYTQKILISLFKILREEADTFLDRVNLSEKLKLITSADDLLAIRDIRNQIAHEYKQEKIEELFEDVLEMVDQLFKSFDMTRKFIAEKSIFQC